MMQGTPRQLSGCPAWTVFAIMGLLTCVQMTSCALDAIGGPITIRDSTSPPTTASPYGATIDLSGVSGTAAVTLRLNGLSHAHPNDIDMVLVSPTGKKALVLADVGGTISVSNLIITLDDAAPSGLLVGGPLTSGTFRPTNGSGAADNFPFVTTTGVGSALSVFTGENPNGTWRLYIIDDAMTNAGSLSSWVLHIDPPTPPANDDLANAIMISGALPISVAGTAFGGTPEAGEPLLPTGGPARFSVWYAWTPSTTGDYVMEISGNNFDTVLGVYTGAAPGALTEIAANDDSPWSASGDSGLIFSANAGTTYLVRIDGSNASNGLEVGDFTLDIHVPTAPTMSATSTMTGQVGVAFDQMVSATDFPSAFTAVGLPPGLSIDSATGHITGVPTTRGATVATITASNTAGSAVQALTMTVQASPTITSALDAAALLSAPMMYQILATNAPTSYDATPLPPGLAIDTTTGVISGAPTAAGSYDIDITATNADGSDTQTLTLYVNLATAPTITSPDVGNGRVGIPFLYAIDATNSPTDYEANGLPADLSLDTNGVISGTPTVAGTWPITVLATNADGTAVGFVAITIADAPAPITKRPPCGVGALATTGMLVVMVMGWRRRSPGEL